MRSSRVSSVERERAPSEAPSRTGQPKYARDADVLALDAQLKRIDREGQESLSLIMETRSMVEGLRSSVDELKAQLHAATGRLERVVDEVRESLVQRVATVQADAAAAARESSGLATLPSSAEVEHGLPGG